MVSLLITFYSLVNGIDPSVSFQIARVESNMNVNAISKTKDGGLFQLNTKYHKFHNSKWIFDPEINTALAMNKLASFKKLCSSRLKRNFKNSYVLCYNMGIVGASRIKKPENQSYIRKMNILWRN